jgi:hypothetical protein
VSNNIPESTPIASSEANKNILPTDKALAPSRRLRSLIRPAILGFYSAVLVAAVIAAYSWGSNVSTNSSNATAIANSWVTALTIVSVLAALLVGLGLPLAWTKGRGFAKTLEVVGFETIFLVIALLISGYILFNGTASGSPNPVIVPGGCGQASGVYCPEN